MKVGQGYGGQVALVFESSLEQSFDLLLLILCWNACKGQKGMKHPIEMCMVQKSNTLSTCIGNEQFKAFFDCKFFCIAGACFHEAKKRVCFVLSFVARYWPI